MKRTQIKKEMELKVKRVSKGDAEDVKAELRAEDPRVEEPKSIAKKEKVTRKRERQLELPKKRSLFLLTKSICMEIGRSPEPGFMLLLKLKYLRCPRILCQSLMRPPTTRLRSNLRKRLTLSMTRSESLESASMRRFSFSRPINQAKVL